MVDEKWEEIEKPTFLSGGLMRKKVFGGWIVLQTSGGSICFVPDHTYEWNIKSNP